MKPSSLTVRVIAIISTALAIASGLLVLAGYFFDRNVLGGDSLLAQVRITLLNWAIILAGFAIFAGIFNLVAVHVKKLPARQKGYGYSLILVFSLLVIFIVGLFSPQKAAVLFTTFQLPVEASLMALLAVTLILASMRLLRRRFSSLSIIFIVTVLLILLGTAPLPFVGNIPILGDLVHPFISRVLASAGARGILIGVALGTLTTGLRILFGVDRPFGGSN